MITLGKVTLTTDSSVCACLCM